MQTKIFILILFIRSIIQITSLSSDQIVNQCHCDLTSSFCDFGCCCDLDCSKSISASCFNQNSKQYCPSPLFFKSLNGNSDNTIHCYNFNSTTTIIDELSMSSVQKNQLISQNARISPISSKLDTGYIGYKLSSNLVIGGVSAFSFASSTGNCLTTGGTTTFALKFGRNVKISCISTSGTPLIFSQIMGKTVPQFYGISSNNITLPIIADSTMTKLTLNFVLGTYGSQGTKYIDRVSSSYQSSSITTIRTLVLNFIQPSNIKMQVTSASFFPQIPSDMFYPIHMMS